MNPNRKRPSRFEPQMQNQNPAKNMNYGNYSGMNYNQNDVFSARDMGPIGMQRPPNKTTEQLAFVS